MTPLQEIPRYHRNASFSESPVYIIQEPEKFERDENGCIFPG